MFSYYYIPHTPPHRKVLIINSEHFYKTARAYYYIGLLDHYVLSLNERFISSGTETVPDGECPETCPTDPTDPNNNNNNNGNNNNGNNNNGNNNNGDNNNNNGNNNSTNNNNFSPRMSSTILTWTPILLVWGLIAKIL